MFFNATDEERIGKDLTKDLNDKILYIKNAFQSIINATVDVLNDANVKIDLMNSLSSEAYSIANLEMQTIFDCLAKRSYDSEHIWKCFH